MIGTVPGMTTQVAIPLYCLPLVRKNRLTQTIDILYAATTLKI